MGFVVKGHITGLQDVFRRVGELKRGLRNRILRKAIGQAATVVKNAVKAAAPRETNLLRKSMGVKIKTYLRSGTVTAIIGPRTGHKQTVKIRPDRVFRQLGGRTQRIRRPRADQLMAVRNPSRTAHLVERGVHAGAITRPAKPFMRPAFQRTREQARAIIENVIRQELAKIGR